ncbi:hypothetical protein JHK85_034748 [Glycine max]|nr:hypothetical protein JHK85_034748 [Glycine max]KAG4986419.1 hypothetical protein JHK86_034110 [Glycine max]
MNVILSKQIGVALGIEVDDKMSQHECYEYFGPDYTLHVSPSNMENKNSHHLLEEIRSKVRENLSKLQHAPSVQFQERPPDSDLGESIDRVSCTTIVHEAFYCHHRHNDGYVPTQPIDHTSQYPNQNQSQTSANPNQNSTKVRAPRQEPPKLVVPVMNGNLWSLCEPKHEPQWQLE